MFFETQKQPKQMQTRKALGDEENKNLEELDEGSHFA